MKNGVYIRTMKIIKIKSKAYNAAHKYFERKDKFKEICLIIIIKHKEIADKLEVKIDVVKSWFRRKK